MDRTSASIAALVMLVVAGLSWAASWKIGEPDKEGAVAAALAAEIGQWVDASTLYGGDPTIPASTLCLASAIPLRINEIAKALEGTIIRPAPVETCTSERIEGDFGMFTAIMNYYDREGKSAAHFEVSGVDCRSSKICVVDIDGFGAGFSYLVERDRDKWTVVNQRLRWIV